MWWSLPLEFTNQKLSFKEENLTTILWGSSMAPFVRLSKRHPSLASHARIVQQHIFSVFEWPLKSSHRSVWFIWEVISQHWCHRKDLLNFKHSLLEHFVCCVLIQPVIWELCWRLYVFPRITFSRNLHVDWRGDSTVKNMHCSRRAPCFCSQHPHCNQSPQNSSYRGSDTFSWSPWAPAMHSRATLIHIK